MIQGMPHNVLYAELKAPCSPVRLADASCSDPHMHAYQNCIDLSIQGEVDRGMHANSKRFPHIQLECGRLRCHAMPCSLTLRKPFCFALPYQYRLHGDCTDIKPLPGAR